MKIVFSHTEWPPFFLAPIQRGPFFGTNSNDPYFSTKSYTELGRMRTPVRDPFPYGIRHEIRHIHCDSMKYDLMLHWITMNMPYPVYMYATFIFECRPDGGSKMGACWQVQPVTIFNVWVCLPLPIRLKDKTKTNRQKTTINLCSEYVAVYYQFLETVLMNTLHSVFLIQMCYWSLNLRSSEDQVYKISFRDFIL